MELILTLWIVWIIGGAVIANAKEKSIPMGAVLGLLFGPLGWLLIFGLPGKKCPHCLGNLPEGLVAKCRHCGSDLLTPLAKAPAARTCCGLPMDGVFVNGKGMLECRKCSARIPD